MNVLFALVIFAYTGCIQWVGDTTYDFGPLEKGDEKSCVFKFRNCSGAAIVIQNVRPSCGCTIPDYSEEAIQPGAMSEIKVVFTARTQGRFSRLIKVYFDNQPKAERLFVEGEVK
jgi:hypothetical protein